MSEFNKTNVPQEFYRSGEHVVVETVGELREKLSLLPADLPLAEPSVCIVFNVGKDEPGMHTHFGLEEAEDWCDE